MRWLLLLVLVTAVWFLAHAADGARRLMRNYRRGLPPGSRASTSIMPGMIVMPMASMSIAVVADKFLAPWGFGIVAFLHLVWGIYLFGYIALTIIRVRKNHRRA